MHAQERGHHEGRCQIIKSSDEPEEYTFLVQVTLQVGDENLVFHLEHLEVGGMT